MRTKLFAIAAVLMMLTASLAVAVAQEGKGKEMRGKKLLHRYQVVYHQAEHLRIGMEAVIQYITIEANAGTLSVVDGNAGTLVIIKDEFVAKEGELKTAAENNDFSGFKQVTNDMRRLVKNFRDEAHSILGNKVGEAKKMAAKAVQENRDYLNSLVEDINRGREEVELEEMDEAVDKAEKAAAKGMNVSELREKLAEIKEKREILKNKTEAAIATCAGIGLGKCNTTEAQEYRALKQEIKEEFKELKEIARRAGRGHKIANDIRASRRTVERLENLISRAEERGADVAVVEAKLDEVSRLVDSAEDKYEAGDYMGAIEDLKASKVAFISAMREFKTLRVEKARGRENKTQGKPERARGRQ